MLCGWLVSLFSSFVAVEFFGVVVVNFFQLFL